MFRGNLGLCLELLYGFYVENSPDRSRKNGVEKNRKSNDFRRNVDFALFALISNPVKDKLTYLKPQFLKHRIFLSSPTKETNSNTIFFVF